MATINALIDLARIPLNDSMKLRYPDDILLAFANAGIYRAVEIRPDLRFGLYGTPMTDVDLSDAFPFPGHFLQTLADYVTGRAMSSSDVASASAAAPAYAKLFELALLA